MKRCFILVVCMFISIDSFAYWRDILSGTEEANAIASMLRVYQGYDIYTKKLLQFVRMGRDYDGGYVVPTVALEQADVIFGYGISNDISFEDQISLVYQKPAYGFDCTVDSVTPSSPNCFFIPSCVGPRSCHLPQYACFEDHLAMNGMLGKKVFLKMDIEGGEYEAIPDILQNASWITGIVLEIHFMQDEQIVKTISLLKQLERDFILVHVHGNNYSPFAFRSANSQGEIPRVLELTYVNRSLVLGCFLAEDQSHPTSLDMSNCKEMADCQFALDCSN